MGNRVFVAPGDDVALDRPSLFGPAPMTSEGLLEQCAYWADEVGWALVETLGDADAAVAGPGVELSRVAIETVQTDRSQGVDGFRWAIRHLAFSRQWPFDTVPYGLIADREMDVRHPRRTRRGVAVLLHGGFWMESWRRDLMEGIAVDLAQQGWQSYNVEYGRVGGTGGWPQTGEDVLSALDAVTRDADSEHLCVVGHSAGGQLALWAAAQRRQIVDCVVSLAGVCDLEQAQRMRLGGGAVERFLDGEPVATASPVDHLNHDATVVLVHCDGDTVVPPQQSIRYAKAAASAGVDARAIVVPDGDHMSLIEPARLWPVARDAMFAAVADRSS